MAGVLHPRLEIKPHFLPFWSLFVGFLEPFYCLWKPDTWKPGGGKVWMSQHFCQDELNEPFPYEWVDIIGLANFIEWSIIDITSVNYKTIRASYKDMQHIPGIPVKPDNHNTRLCQVTPINIFPAALHSWLMKTEDQPGSGQRFTVMFKWLVNSRFFSCRILNMFPTANKNLFYFIHENK